MNTQPIISVLNRYAHDFHPVVDFNPATDKLLAMDFTAANEELTGEIIDDTKKFSAYVNQNSKMPMQSLALVVMLRTEQCTVAVHCLAIRYR